MNKRRNKILEKYASTPLSDSLGVHAIAKLWAESDESVQEYQKAIDNAVRQEKLRVREPEGIESFAHWTDGALMYMRRDGTGGVVRIHKDDFEEWLKEEDAWPLDATIQLSKWWPSNFVENGGRSDARGKQTRKHELHEVIKRAYDGLSKRLGHDPSNREVWENLQDTDFDENETIQEMTNDTISWMSWRGKERTMKRSTFDNRLALIRNLR